jgi:hypothetical protein
MSRDLLLKTTSINWARGDSSCRPSPVALPPTPRITLNAEEKKRVAKLAALRARAASGDEMARKKWRFTQAKVAMMREQARSGDKMAARSCQVLEQSGLFGKSVKVTSASGFETHKTYLADASVEPGKAATLVLEPRVAISSPTLTVVTSDGNFELIGIVRGGKVVFPHATLQDLRGGLVVPGVVSREAPLKIAVRNTGAGRGVVNAELNGTAVSGREESCGREEILGEFVGDEERMARDAGPAERDASARVRGDYQHRGGDRGRRARQLRKLVWRATRGDAGAAARLQQVTSSLQQRASSGDARATALVQKIQAMQARAQSQLAAQQAQQAQATAPATTPVAAPPPPPAAASLNVTYAAPASDYSDDYE